MIWCYDITKRQWRSTVPSGMVCELENDTSTREVRQLWFASVGDKQHVELRIYLHGLKFEIFTDCSAFLQSILKKELILQVAKWALYISQFEATMKHRQGKQIKHLVALSRMPAVMIIEDGLVAKVKSLQKQNEKYKLIENILATKSYENYTLHGGALYKWIYGVQLMVVPKKLHNEVIRSTHERCHLGAKKTVSCEGNISLRIWLIKYQKIISNCIMFILATRK